MKSLILLAFLLTVTAVNAQILDNIRELSELNNPNETDAYPYITDDGLRLYFTSSDGAGNNLYFAARPNLTTDFGPRHMVDSSLFLGLLSSWFTNDELEIFYTNSSGLYHATRASVSDPFGAPTQITLSGVSPSFLSAPSRTPDGNELFIYDGTTMQRFDYMNDSTYTYHSDVSVPVGYETAPGQLSKDGLTLYWSLKTFGSDSTRLFVAERSALGDDFDDSEQMDGILNSPGLVNSQPSYATSANVMVWMRGFQPTWEQNQLYIANGPMASVDELANNASNKELVKIVDLLGRETDFVPGVVLIYVYSDGSTEKRMVVE